MKFCPLVPAWATTIHKFQGFEAGFEKTDQFKYLLVDPGNLSWEQKCPGALYVALSRARTMGTFWSDTHNPTDSAIYWHGSGMSEMRIAHGALKKGKRNGDAKVNCVLIDKRDKWVRYLTKKGNNTTKKIYTEEHIEYLRRKRFSRAQTRDGIVDIITEPNESWLHQKREHYRIQKTYFGNA